MTFPLLKRLRAVLLKRGAKVQEKNVSTKKVVEPTPKKTQASKQSTGPSGRTDTVQIKRVGRKQILAIKPGKTAVFTLPTGRARESARSTCSGLQLIHPRPGVLRYSCKYLSPTSEGFPIAITAIRNDKT